MKITAAVDSKLGATELKQGKTYDVKPDEARFLLRNGLARLSDSEVEKGTKETAVVVPKTEDATKASGKAGK